MSQDVIATVSPTPVRRALAVGMLAMLGGLLLYLALGASLAGLGWQAFLLAVGVAALVLAEAVRRATAHAVVMTEETLSDTSGRLLCRIDEITGVERGAFAFKPSNGFLVRVARPGPRAWVPGLWWRVGRRIGIGGVTPAAQSKYMSEMIAMRLVERERRGSGV